MFLNNIKINYYDKLIKQSIQNNQPLEIKKALSELQKNHELLLKILKSNIFKICENQSFRDIFPQNIVWVNSYNMDDTKIINQFLNYYFENMNFSYLPAESYPQKIFKLFDFLKIKGDIEFDEIVNFSYVYQYIISIFNQEKLIILNSSSAFFESRIGRLFSHYFITKSFFYIVRDPYAIYSQIKSANNLTNHEAVNSLLNLDNSISHVHDSNTNRVYHENKQGWHTNVSSWSNQNVINTFRGLVFRLEDIVSKPEESFADMIAHLIQAGVKIKLDYQVINNFITENKNILKIDIRSVDISNNEQKLLNREIGDLVKKLKYNPNN